MRPIVTIRIPAVHSHISKKELILWPNHFHQDNTVTPFIVAVMRLRVLWLL